MKNPQVLVGLAFSLGFGFMANSILPLRVGELIRTYVLPHLTPVRLSTALATTALERVWDVIIIALLFVWISPRFPFGSA